MGGAMFSKPLIGFFVDRWGCVPSLLFDLRPNYVVDKEDNGDFPHKVLLLCAPNPAAGHCQPTPRLRLLDAHGQVWVSLLWGHCSFLLGPGAHKVLFVPSKSLFLSPV